MLPLRRYVIVIKCRSAAILQKFSRKRLLIPSAGHASLGGERKGVEKLNVMVLKTCFLICCKDIFFGCVGTLNHAGRQHYVLSDVIIALDGI